MTDISIIIPSRGRHEILEQVCKSLIQQQHIPATNYEIIIVADGIDEPINPPFKIQLSEPNIRYYRITHGGPAQARNYGVSQSQGDLLLFIGNDTIAAPDLLYQHWQYYQKYPTDACVGKILSENEGMGTNLDRFLMRGSQFRFPDDSQELDFWQFYTANVSFSRTRFDAVGGFVETFKKAAWEDIEFGFRFQQKSVIRYCSEATVRHVHPTTFQNFVERQKMLGQEVNRLLDLHQELDRYFKLRSSVFLNFLRRILISMPLTSFTLCLHPLVEKLAYSIPVHYYFRIVRYQFFYRGYCDIIKRERGKRHYE